MKAGGNLPVDTPVHSYTMKKSQHIYGPVPSRRLGRSLGIDLVPHKICTYDCIYCQIGKTTKRTLLRKEYVPVKEVLKEVELFLQEEFSPIDHFSLSGSGEPTLHSKIGSVIKEIKAISSIPIAVITNGSLLFQKKVREDLLGADIVLPSLDAVTSDAFQRINRPHPKLSVEKVIEGIAEFRKVYNGQIWLEILFCKGFNDTSIELQKMKEAVKRIQPDLIHINTVVRPPSEDWVKPLSQKGLEKIKAFFGKRASIISKFDRHITSVSKRDLKEEILKILRRRPLSLSDLSKGMGIPRSKLQAYLRPLIQEGKIKARSFGGSIYYEMK
jgi:wyosine [tRNA(Phe)-imidazoG37] synthetase (radical SAM superfamily)